MNHAQALHIAQKWMKLIEPFTERREIAGSLRRCKPEVKDIEIVCIPKLGQERDLFQNSTEYNMLDRFIVEERILCTKNGSRYKQIVTGEFIKIDLFCVLPPAQWGVQFLIRTGPADYSKRFVTQRKWGGMLPSNMKVQDGAIWQNGAILETPEESDVYTLIGEKWIEPRERR